MKCSVLWNNVLGDFFAVNCGVRQGGVLPAILLSIYVDDLIDELRNSGGYGIYIGRLFLGCILYADDILLLSSTCYGLQSMLNCVLNLETNSIVFNLAKTQVCNIWW